MTDIDRGKFYIDAADLRDDEIHGPPPFGIVDGLQLNLMLGPINKSDAHWLFDQLQRLAPFQGVITLSVSGYGVDVKVTNAKAVKIPWQQR